MTDQEIAEAVSYAEECIESNRLYSANENEDSPTVVMAKALVAAHSRLQSIPTDAEFEEMLYDALEESHERSYAILQGGSATDTPCRDAVSAAFSKLKAERDELRREVNQYREENIQLHTDINELRKYVR